MGEVLWFGILFPPCCFGVSDMFSQVKSQMTFLAQDDQIRVLIILRRSL